MNGRLLLLLGPILLLVAGSTPGSEDGWVRHVVDNTSRGADGVRLADVNADGLLDIATGWEEGGEVRVYVNPGPRHSQNPWPTVTVGRVDSPEDAVLVDLDNDGAVDVVSCCEGRNKTVFVHWAPRHWSDFLQTEAWRTTALSATENRQAWMFALPFDVDGKNGIDLVVGSKGEDAAVGWLQAPQNARHVDEWRYRPLCDAGWIMSVQPHDMDIDGDLDLLVSDRRGPTRGVFWLENLEPNEPDGKWPRRQIGGQEREVMFLTRGVLDNHPHVVAAVRDKGLSVFRSSESRSSNAFEISMPQNCGTGKGVAVGDINLDGRNDIVLSCENANGDRSGVRWLSQIDDGTWADYEISGRSGIKFDRVELIDLDADGDLDVLTCEERANLGVIWYENPTR